MSINRISRRRSRRRGAAAALALGFCVTASAAGPVQAACSSTPVTIFRVDGSYSCYRDCAVKGGHARVMRTMYFTEPDSTGGFVAAQNECYRACSTTPGCTSIGFLDWYDSRGRHHLQCMLFSNSSHETTVYDRPGGRAPDGGVADDGWVCHRLPSQFRDPGEHIDRNHFRPDVYRPGSPGPSSPGKK